MIDNMLFQRGHIMTRIGDRVDDYDNAIPDQYFENVLGLKGECIDSNGSEYNLVSIDSKDNFVIDFSVYGNDFETEDGAVQSFEELMVQCTGVIVQEEDYDVLQINTYEVINVN